VPTERNSKRTIGTGECHGEREVESLRHDSGKSWSNQGTATLEGGQRRARLANPFDRALKRVLDVAVSAILLVLTSPLIAVLAVAIRLDSRGPAFYRCRRVGLRGRPLRMLKFRKMHDGASGPALSSPDDVRFTRLGSFLARTKLDELPQLWNVLKGEMSLVGPRPEDPTFVELRSAAYSTILEVRPGITGLSQLAFASETDVLDPEDRMGHYVDRILPQKIGMDSLYARQRTLGMDLKVLWWTLRAVAGGSTVAVNRESGRLTPRAPRTTPLEERPPALQLDEAAPAFLMQQKAS
jgi:lipopolysaccharide/colanic/teichoic acid biosynthesis glycosyltransferase